MPPTQAGSLDPELVSYAVALGSAGLIGFILLPPRVKALISFILMMQFFDTTPRILLGLYVWDYGAVLLLITAVDLYLRKPVIGLERHAYLGILKLFIGWQLFCFAWSLLVYQYPLVHTLKNARGLIIGYSSTLVFIRLFRVDPGSFGFLLKWTYWLTLVLMPLAIGQYLFHATILVGALSTDYEGVKRTLPVFLPFCLLYFWIISTKLLSFEKLAVHEMVYLALASLTVALTFTRGLYVAVVLVGAVLLWTLSRQGLLRMSSVLLVLLGALVIGAGLLATDTGQRVVGRAASALAILGSAEPGADAKSKDDTFSGRLGLASERFSMVLSYNPFLGYGFIHEDDVPSEVRAELKYGTPLGGTSADPTSYSRTYEYSSTLVLGLYTADIAWADIVICTGFVGLLLLVLLLAGFFSDYARQGDATHPLGFAVRNGLFLEVMTLFFLTLNGNSFYGMVQIPALLIAGYSLSGRHPVRARVPAVQMRPANLLA